MPTLAARVFVNAGGDPICILQNLTLQVGDRVVLARKWSGKILTEIVGFVHLGLGREF